MPRGRGTRALFPRLLQRSHRPRVWCPGASNSWQKSSPRARCALPRACHVVAKHGYARSITYNYNHHHVASCLHQTYHFSQRCRVIWLMQTVDNCPPPPLCPRGADSATSMSVFLFFDFFFGFFYFTSPTQKPSPKSTQSLHLGGGEEEGGGGGGGGGNGRRR